MPLKIRLVHHVKPKKQWYRASKPMERWKNYFMPPWLLIIHFSEILILFTILFRLIIPNVRDTFLIRSMFAQNLCFDIDLHVPISRISDIDDFIQNFNNNLELFVSGSFMHIYYVNQDKPYDFLVTWTNGTTTSTLDVAITTDFFRHITKFRVETSLYFVLPNSKYKGCTKWVIATEIIKSEGSYTFSAAPCISRSKCPKSFMDQITYQSSMKEKQIEILNERNRIKYQLYLEKHKKGDQQSVESGVSLDDSSYSKLRNAKVSDPIPLLPDEILKQASDLENYAGNLVFLSIAGTITLIFSLKHRWRHHTRWRQKDPVYRDLEVYEQIHLSLGFWHPLHFVMEIILLATSIVLLVESQVMTQFISLKSMQVYAVGFFLTVCIAPRWFILWPNVYQVVLIIRVAFTRLVSTFVGLLPIICAFMMFAVFLFGLVSDITKNYYRYMQLFLGLVFGDDTYNIFGYFSDGTLLYDILSFFFTMLIALLAGYIFFPAFTATISFLRSKEVIVIQEKKSDDEE